MLLHSNIMQVSLWVIDVFINSVATGWEWEFWLLNATKMFFHLRTQKYWNIILMWKWELRKSTGPTVDTTMNELKYFISCYVIWHQKHMRYPNCRMINETLFFKQLVARIESYCFKFVNFSMLTENRFELFKPFTFFSPFSANWASFLFIDKIFLQNISHVCEKVIWFV